MLLHDTSSNRTRSSQFIASQWYSVQRRITSTPVRQTIVWVAVDRGEHDDSKFALWTALKMEVFTNPYRISQVRKLYMLTAIVAMLEFPSVSMCSTRLQTPRFHVGHESIGISSHRSIIINQQIHSASIKSSSRYFTFKRSSVYSPLKFQSSSSSFPFAPLKLSDNSLLFSSVASYAYSFFTKAISSFNWAINGRARSQEGGPSL